MRRSILRGALIIAAAALLPSALSAADRLVLIADHAVLPDGSLAGPTAVIVERGLISRVLPAAAAEGDPGPVLRFRAGSVISPGLIDVASGLGMRSGSAERDAAVQADAVAAEAFDGWSPELGEALHRGVTAAVVIPDLMNVVAGRSSVIRTGGGPGGAGTVLEPLGPTAASVGARTLTADRKPTARSGSVTLFREWARSDAAQTPLPPMVAADDAADAASVLQITSRWDRPPTLVLGSEGMQTAALINEGYEVGAVVLGPFGPGTPPREARGAAALAEAGVPIIFTGSLGAQPAVSLRMTAALAVREGLDPSAARRAMTVEPARASGVAERIGSLTPGLLADLVIFSSDPLRPDARVEAVVVGGELVHAAENAATPIVKERGR